MDLMVDKDKLMELIRTLDDASGVVENNTDTIYRGIDAMEGSWSGPEYDDFKTKAGEFRNYFASMSDQYKVMSQFLISDIKNEVISDFFNAIEEAYNELGGS